ncbi:MAG: two-component system sensor histidine kinase NtrB [Desulfurivibrionaceae bacterium]
MQRESSKNTHKILEIAVENTNDAFVTIDEDHQVIFFNRAAEKIFGYSRTEVVGRDLDTIMAPACSNNHRKAVERYVRTRVPELIDHVNEIDIVRKDGETFPAEISFSVAELEGRLYFTGIVRDLTETKALKDQIHKSERLAALGRFVAETTHEIKRPLMLIGAYSRQLLKGKDIEKADARLGMIVDEVDRLENLLLELREMYQQRSLNYQEVDIIDLLQNVLLLIEDECREKPIDLTARTCRGPVFIEGDIEKLKQVFLNIINNSIEATPEKGRLSVETELSGGQVTVAIRDNGCGISEEDKKNIFSPFFTTKNHGTGLGLSITKDIIEKHKGCSFTVESEEGKGTTFRVILPVRHNTFLKNMD